MSVATFVGWLEGRQIGVTVETDNLGTVRVFVAERGNPSEVWGWTEELPQVTA